MKQRNCLYIFALIASFCFFSTASAALSPEGNWKTISDITNKPRSIMTLNVNNGVLDGRITKVFKVPGDQGICDKCPGNFKDKPIMGMQIMWGLKQTSDGVWDGGKILDPKSGKVYSCKVTISPDGKTMTVRGYLGMSLLGRSQTWVKQ